METENTYENFYSELELKTSQKIISFYKKQGLEIKFKSITSYFNFKSYSFTKNESVKLNDFEELSRYLKVKPIRVVSTDKNHVSFEIYNKKRNSYPFLEAVQYERFQSPNEIVLPILLGERNGAYITDLAEMPHLLIAGAVGSGANVFIHSLILSLLYHHSPETLKLILVDPKVVELSIYNDIPHLLTPVITNDKKAINALAWCIDEMERRYCLLSEARVRNIIGYNEKVAQDTKLPYIVLMIYEFASIAPFKTVEEYIAKLAPKARAVGIHLILATQKPSIDVLTGLIKVNIPSHIGFTTSSSFDSRTILDIDGAECLCGCGDMLFSRSDASDVLRIQSPTISDEEILDITDKFRATSKPNYIDIPDLDISEFYTEIEADPLLEDVFAFIIETGVTSISAIQRKFALGFNRVEKMIDYLEYKGVLSAKLENGKREVLKTEL